MHSLPRPRLKLRPALFLLVPALLLAVSACIPLDSSQSTFETRGPVAERQADIFKLIFWIAVAVFVLVEGLIIYITVRYRRRRDDEMPAQTHGNNKLEITWTLVPVVILVAIAIPTIDGIWDLNEPPDDGRIPVSVEAVGHQWWFEFRYPNEQIVTANELHVPYGRPVVVKLLSQDVIHSFWVPSLAGKVDMIPINENSLWFEVDEPDEQDAVQTPEEILGQCAEFCGIAHAHMRFRVFAHTPEEYEVWLDDMRTPSDVPVSGSTEERGQTLFRDNCSTCHTVESYRTGGYDAEILSQDTRWAGWQFDIENAQIVSAPNLTHFGTRRTLGAGITDLNEENLVKWITDPSSFKIGTRMQEHAAVYQTGDGKAKLDQEDITAIAKYLLSLKPGSAPPPSGGDSTTEGSPAERGEALFAASGCTACHSTGTNDLIGPGLAGVAGRAGSRVPGLDANAYLTESIRESSAYVVDGFSPVMPLFPRLDDQDVSDLVAYLSTLN